MIESSKDKLSRGVEGMLSPPSEAACRIRQYILRHELKPGDQLPTHEELGRRLKLGCRRLREGLHILRHQGVVEIRHKAGTIVRQPSMRTISEPISWHLDTTGCRFEDLVAARACIESGAAAEAARRRSARDLLVILDALEQLETQADSPEGDLLEDEGFHMAILHATRNPAIVAFGQLVRIQFQDKTQRIDPPRQRRLINREHRHIYEVIERQDDGAARERMYSHIMGQLVSTS
jgi:GntR family transcriptional regulator, transcriptional repressor for pyruvate dehydrogenase complex